MEKIKNENCSMKKIVITGATGTIGTPTLAYLNALTAGTGTGIIACVRDLQQAVRIRSVSPKAEVRLLDFEDPATFAPALEGADILFLLRPPQLSDANIFRPFLQQAKTSGIEGIVFLSVQGADKQRFIPHARIEKIIRESGLPYIFLRPGYFMQNLTTTLAQDVSEGTIMLPAGNAPFMWTDADNIGEVAAHVLLRFNEFDNSVFDITGSEPVSFSEAVSRINAATDSKLKYRNVNLLRFWQHRRAQGTPPEMIAVMIMLHFLPRIQKPPAISTAYCDITGKEPFTLAEFARREMSDYRPGEIPNI